MWTPGKLTLDELFAHGHDLLKERVNGGALAKA